MPAGTVVSTSKVQKKGQFGRLWLRIKRRLQTKFPELDMDNVLIYTIAERYAL